MPKITAKFELDHPVRDL